MGDFNFDDGDTENELFEKDGTLIDCWDKYLNNCEKNNIGVNIRLIQGVTRIKPIENNQTLERRLDKMKIRSKIWKVKSFDIIGEIGMPSDHLGIFTVFERK